MLTKRVVSHFRTQDWSALLSELIIVVVGIFIAIQADGWWQGQQDLEREQAYIGRLITDLERDLEALSSADYLLSLRQGFALISELVLVRRVRTFQVG